MTASFMFIHSVTVIYSLAVPCVLVSRLTLRTWFLRRAKGRLLTRHDKEAGQRDEKQR